MKETTKTKLFAWLILAGAAYFILGAPVDSLIRIIAFVVVYLVVNNSYNKEIKESEEIDIFNRKINQAWPKE